MKALDSLKADIDDYNEVIASEMEHLHFKIEKLCQEYYKMELFEIDNRIRDIHDDINQIGRETVVLRKMESYYKIFKQEQDNINNNNYNDFKKWTSDAFEKETLL